MNFKKFMDLYDNWNVVVRINDNNLNMIAEERMGILMDKRIDLYNKKVVAFGFYDGILCVRIK